MIVFLEIVEIVKEIVNKEEFNLWDKLNKEELKNNHGVYLIKKKDGEIIYIGSAPKQTLRSRLLKGHLEGKNTALTRKAPKLYGEKTYSKKEYANLSKEEKKKIGDYLKDNCLFLIWPIKDFDEVLAIEHLLILYYRKALREKGFELLNDYKE